MAETMLIAGMGRSADAAAVMLVSGLAVCISLLWLISMAARKPTVKGSELFGFLAFWLVTIGLSLFIWIGGRMADERKHREAFELDSDQLPLKSP